MPPDPASDFVQLVRELRLAQKLYFRTKRPDALAASKRLEAQVDQYLATRDAAQPALFDTEEEPHGL